MSALNIPLRIVRFGIRCMVLSLYRVRVEGAENIPKTGGVLIISNHLSFMDGFLAGCPLGLTGTQREIDTAIVFLASAASSYITGSTLAIDGGTSGH